MSGEMWLDKRDVAAYYLLRRKFGIATIFNIGEAIDTLTEYYPRRAAYSIFRRLVRLGVIKRVGFQEYQLMDLCQWLFERSESYLKARHNRQGVRSGTSSSSFS